MFSCGRAWSNAALLIASVSVNCPVAPVSVTANTAVPSPQSHLTVQKLVITLGVLLAHLSTGNVGLKTRGGHPSEDPTSGTILVYLREAVLSP